MRAEVHAEMLGVQAAAYGALNTYSSRSWYAISLIQRLAHDGGALGAR